MSQIDKRKIAAEKHAIWLRNYQRVRGRALTRLTKEYPERYREIFEEERAKDEAEGKSWLDITGRTKRSLGGAGAPDGDASVSIGHTDSNESQARNLGAEA